MKESFLIYFLGLLVYSNFAVDASQPRIIGGSTAHISGYPFSAAIYVETPTSRFFCGGTLYNDQWIITAGQCVNGATLFTIHLGSNSLSREDENRVTVATSEYFLHPDFDPETLNNDIGLIKLRMTVQFSGQIDRIRYLALGPINPKIQFRAIGWGQTNDHNSSLSDELQVTYVTALSNEECKIYYGNQITESMVCIEGNYNEGSCHGDTGSPLLQPFTRLYYIIMGIASFVSSNGCESTNPSGYTRIYPFISWIRNVTST